MEKVEIRAVIKYMCKKGMSPKEILENTSIHGYIWEGVPFL
jgi:hypothetical protein